MKNYQLAVMPSYLAFLLHFPLFPPLLNHIVDSSPIHQLYAKLFDFHLAILVSDIKWIHNAEHRIGLHFEQSVCLLPLIMQTLLY